MPSPAVDQLGSDLTHPLPAPSKLSNLRLVLIDKHPGGGLAPPVPVVEKWAGKEKNITVAKRTHSGTCTCTLVGY